MIILDNALRKRAEEGRPIRVGMVGAGFMAQPIARRLFQQVEGIDLVCIANRTVERAAEALRLAGVDDPVQVDTVEALEAAIAAGAPGVHRRSPRHVRGRTASTSFSRSPARSRTARGSCSTRSITASTCCS